ncbi:hypothetical protein PAHAL_2G025100 [Panicum hallii]|uniref:Uncharacterized protein n=1 Tax=Panicum hallii TaxID=206008 RepID=A0A2T8KMQ6_9POAL|nr:hypothetical protein PAHAL_2G025100 [Panicum hallii]
MVRTAKAGGRTLVTIRRKHISWPASRFLARAKREREFLDGGLLSWTLQRPSSNNALIHPTCIRKYRMV